MRTEIRQENENDVETVACLIRTAFENSEFGYGGEAELVEKLRKSHAFVPQLSLVALVEEKIVGHILFTKVGVGETTQLALAPLAVLPEYRRRGIGTALIARGHEIAAQLGYEYSIVLGDLYFYSQSGYQSASLYGVRAPLEEMQPHLSAIRLQKNAAPLKATVAYDAAFGIEPPTAVSNELIDAGDSVESSF